MANPTDPKTHSAATPEQEAADIASVSTGAGLNSIPPERWIVPVQIAAVVYWHEEIGLIDRPCLEVQMAAIRSNSSSIEFIDHPHIDAQIAAVIDYPRNLVHIKNPSEDVYFAALQADRDAFRYVKIPLFKMPESVQLAIVKKSPWRIEDFQDPSEELKMAAAQQNGCSVAGLKGLSPAVKRAAVLNDPMCLFDFKDPPNHRLTMLAITLDRRVIKCLSDPTPSMRLVALARFGVQTLDRLPKGVTLPPPAVIRALAENGRNSRSEAEKPPEPSAKKLPGHTELACLLSDWHPRQILKLIRLRPDLFEAGPLCVYAQKDVLKSAAGTSGGRKPAPKPLLRL